MELISYDMKSIVQDCELQSCSLVIPLELLHHILTDIFFLISFVLMSKITTFLLLRFNLFFFGKLKWTEAV